MILCNGALCARITVAKAVIFFLNVVVNKTAETSLTSHSLLCTLRLSHALCDELKCE